MVIIVDKKLNASNGQSVIFVSESINVCKQKITYGICVCIHIRMRTNAYCTMYKYTYGIQVVICHSYHTNKTVLVFLS